MINSIHKQFVKLGLSRNKLTYELLSLLPEIYTRGIFRKYAKTIEEYGGKYGGGLSKRVIRKTINLECYLQNKPLLKAAVKDLGVHKIDLIARVATKETEQYWLDKAKNMSKAALELAVKEYKTGKVGQTLRLKLNSQTTKLFLKLKSELPKNLSNEEALKKLLTELETLKNTKNLPPRVRKLKKVKEINRHIPAAIKQSLGKMCIYKDCNRLANVYHHRLRFSEQKNHESIVPLCTQHHEFAHNGMIKNEPQNPNKWELQINGQLKTADKLYRHYRHKSADRSCPTPTVVIGTPSCLSTNST